MKQKYLYVKCVGFKEFDFINVTIILGQNAINLIRLLDYKSAEEEKPREFKLLLGWKVPGPLPAKFLVMLVVHLVMLQMNVKKSSRSCHEVVELYGISITAVKRSREDKLATEILSSTVHFHGERYEFGLLWNINQSALSSNFASAQGQFRVLNRPLGKASHI